MSPEAAETLKVLGPYLTLALAAIGGLLGYGAIKAKVEGWDKVRAEDLERHEREHAELRRGLELADQAIERNAEQAKRDLDGIGGKVNAMNREIGEVKSAAEKAVESERHRIDEHAKRGQEQQTKNAEYFAQQTQAAMRRAEELVARLEKAIGEPGGPSA